MTSTKQHQDEDQNAQAGAAVYVYGIVPGDVEVEDDAEGIGDPPGKVEIIREGDIAALVSTVRTDRALGKPADLQAHAALLDGTASVAPVLPLRFGAVMTDAESVASELLREHHDEFAQTLKALEGHAEYVVKGRFQEEAFLSDLLSENDQARKLRDDIQAKPEEAARNSRMALGELIANTIEAARQADTQRVINELKGKAEQVNAREPTHEWDAVHVAVLARVDREADLQEIVERLNESARGRMELHLRGPLAAYDFVVTATPET
jgi:Gas vesicle synthesis protein GvpL/GvpF